MVNDGIGIWASDGLGGSVGCADQSRLEGMTTSILIRNDTHTCVALDIKISSAFGSVSPALAALN